MANDDVERIELPPGLTGEQIGVLFKERYDEAMAAEVADLLVQGYTIGQIEIVKQGAEVVATDHGTTKLRVWFTVRGRRPVGEADTDA